MTQYYIDQQLIAMFLDADKESEEVKSYMDKYNEKLTRLMEEGIRKYLKEKKHLSDEQVEAEFAKVDSFDHTADSIILDDDVLIEAERIRHKFHREIYDYYQAVLTNEQKKRINVYLQARQEEIAKDFEEQKKMMLNVLGKIKNEYDGTGQIAEKEAVEDEDDEVTDEDLLAVQEELEEEIKKED